MIIYALLEGDSARWKAKGRVYECKLRVSFAQTLFIDVERDHVVTAIVSEAAISTGQKAHIVALLGVVRYQLLCIVCYGSVGRH